MEVKRYNPNHHPFMRIALVVMCVSIVLPLVLLLVWCFVSYWPFPNLLPDEMNLRGVTEVFEGGSDFWKITWTSISISLCVAVLAVVVSTMVAQAVSCHDIKGKKVVDFLSLLPIIIPDTCVAMGLQASFIRWGFAYTATSVVIALVIRTVPYAIKIMIDVTRILGNSYTEQAMVLGVSRVKAFFRVSLPKLIPGMVSSAGMVFVVSYGLYFLTLIIGGGKIETFAVVVIPYISSGDRTVAAIYAFAYILTGFLGFVIFDFIGKRLTKGRENYLM